MRVPASDLAARCNALYTAAIANAVFHATGVRVRDLPIRAEHLLGASY